MNLVYQCILVLSFFNFYPYTMKTLSINQLFTPKDVLLELVPSSKPITTSSYELHPGFIAIVR
jgi:hypothetical protein